jgi:hypothetical protein
MRGSVKMQDVEGEKQHVYFLFILLDIKWCFARLLMVVCKLNWDEIYPNISIILMGPSETELFKLITNLINYTIHQLSMLGEQK